MGAVNMLAWRLIEAKKTGDYATEHFLPIDAQVKRNFDYYDRLVSRSYVAFSSFEVWNVWYKVWAMGAVFGGMGMFEVLGAYHRTRSVDAFDLAEKPPYCSVQASALPEYAALVEAASREIDAFGEGTHSATETEGRIFDLIVKSGLWPAPWGSPRRRHPGIFTVPTFIPLIGWIKVRAPEALRKTFAVNFQFQDIIAMCAHEWTSELKYDGGLLGTLSRDFVRGYNRDWTRFVRTGSAAPRQ